MLRSAARAGSSKSTEFSLKAFSTWLNTHHVPKAFATEIIDTLERNAPSSVTTRRSASTRVSRYRQAEEPADSSALVPRYIRRQHLQKDASATDLSLKKANGHAGGEPSFSKKPTVYRSKHFDPSTKTAPKSEMRLLEPHVLSARLKKLCEGGKIDDAVVMLKTAPLDAQNTPVWNTLIWETLKAQRYKLSYELYIDMKRRGFSPTTRTFQTFFTGLARIDDWAMFPKQLANAHSLYENYQRLMESIKKHDPKDPDLTSDPLAGYIRVLGKAGQYQELFDVYYSLDKSGPLAPNKFTYTAMLQAMVAAQGDTVEGSVKVAADARLIWTQMIKASLKNPNATPDSHTAVAAITALAGGNKMDYELALKIISDYYGLQADKSPSQPGNFVLGPEALNAILRFCNRSQQYALCNNFFQQMKKRPEPTGGVTIIDRLHMEEILKAEIALGETTGLGYYAVDTLEWMLRQEITAANGPKIRPALSTYHLVFQACWRAVDWNSAMRTFDLMTGFHAHDFKDGAVAEEPRFDQRGPGKNLPPNTEIMSFILRTALISKNRADIRQGLRLVDYIGFEDLLGARNQGGEHHETMKAVKHRAMFGKKLAAAIIESVDYVTAEGGKYARPVEGRSWVALAAKAKAVQKGDGGVSAAGEQHKKSVAEKEEARDGEEERGRGFASKSRSSAREGRSARNPATRERASRESEKQQDWPRRRKSTSRTKDEIDS